MFKDLQNLIGLFDFSNLRKDHELFSQKNINILGTFKAEIPRNKWLDEFICLGSNAYSFKNKDKTQKKWMVLQVLTLKVFILMGNIVVYLEVIFNQNVIVM